MSILSKQQEWSPAQAPNVHAVDALNLKARFLQSLRELGCLVWTIEGSVGTSLLSIT